MSREFDSNESLQKKILNGVNTLANNVGSTLGPKGRNVLLQEKGKDPFITKDGVTVAHFVALEDPFENAAAQIIKQAAVETNNTAGDGTTTATVLARSIIQEAQKHIASGASPVEIQRGINRCVKIIIENLDEMSKPVKSLEDITHIASISANNDHSIGRLISYKIDAVESILPILEMIARESRPLILVAEDLEGQALAAMIMNAMRGTLKIAGIKAPYYGDERRNMLEDLALSVGATFISRSSGTKLKDVQLKHLGSAKFIESNKHMTTIVGGKADHEQVDNKIESLKSEIVATEDIAAADAIQQRVARLASGVAVIKVGGTTEVEMIERKHRIEDALEAVRSAQEEGIIPGGGTGLLRASQKITIVDRDADMSNAEDMTDQYAGIDVVRKACLAPIKQMAQNSGESADIIINEILKADNEQGWNFKTGKMSNMIQSGIIDPVKVTKTALQNAASCAGTLLTTNFGIIQTEGK